MSDENLYKIVKERICDQIYEGIYEDGDKIPAERELAERMDVSRVTIRRALAELEEEGLVRREVGRGTRITFGSRGHPGETDMIVLIAPARNPFFSRFIERFQEYAEERGALLLYVEKPRREILEDCLYRLYKRGLRNVVVWLEDILSDPQKLRRLRALGMNMVFFDSDQGLPYADCVTLDNRQAVWALYEELKRCGCGQIGYVGWDAVGMCSVREREAAYRERAGAQGVFLHMPWKEKSRLEEIVRTVFGQRREELPGALICSDQEVGGAVLRAARGLGIHIRVATVDEIAEEGRGDVVLYRQDLDGTIARIFTCLLAQCRDGGGWRADIYRISGILMS